MHHFFTTESTAPPAISALWYSVMVLLPLGHVCGLVFTRQMEKQTVLCLDGSEWSHLCFGLSSL